MFTKDLNLVFFLFNTINNRSPFKITFCWNFISNAISTNLQPREFIVILKANFRFENCGINCFHFGWGQAYSERPMEVQPEKSKQCQLLPRTWFFILKTSRIDLKKIEEKKKRNEMRYGMVHRSKSKVTDQGYQGYKRHWMSLTFSTLLVVLNKNKKVETVGNYVTK